ncbi:STAS domain-containing protein [Mycolicibacterium goodii]|uniref:Sulfate transporter n=1 Tax=Mycolicibacterium goodii TaxID=134601 RepID=A0ABS6HW84_MYCGD|nr:STAS domain-containing protein [Mycolicibacterium goodii]MBU8825593.1 sulfate transporter [Mycolicibacterium goodii]MBU8836366.1 sulfate transporter [Mycolicibacterium goodii]OKH65039.1 sulfate transporter [Mycobacterium sp. SWH-M5]PJK19857.1 sulfate transporter [Mycolicibacterium goodii]
MPRSRSPLSVSVTSRGEMSLLTIDGVLDSSTYREVRDTVIKAALAEPRAVIVNVSKLKVPTESAWSVFTSARWHVCVWPDVPVLLVCEHDQGRRSLWRNGIRRYVPVCSTLDEACTTVLADRMSPLRRRARAQLPAVHSSVRRSRELVTDWLLSWSLTEYIPVTCVVADALVENVLDHTLSSPKLILESRGDTVTVAVEDESREPAVRHEDPYRGGSRLSGLALVTSIARTWGCTPTTTGKAVWAAIGPESCF